MFFKQLKRFGLLLSICFVLIFFSSFSLSANVYALDSDIDSGQSGTLNWRYYKSEKKLVFSGNGYDKIVKDESWNKYASEVEILVVYNGVGFIEEKAFSDFTNLVDVTLPFVGTTKSEANVYTNVFGAIFDFNTLDATDMLNGYNIETGEYDNPLSLTNINTYCFDDLQTSRNETCVVPSSLYPFNNGSLYFAYYDTDLDEIFYVYCIGNPIFFDNEYDCVNCKLVTDTSWTWQFSECKGEFKYNKSKHPIVSYYYNIPKTIKKVTITDTEYIPDRAFYDCDFIEEINLSYNGVSEIKSIGKGAFCNCQSIKELRIPSSVNSIGEYAFLKMTSLEKIYMYSPITTLKYNDFIIYPYDANQVLVIGNDEIMINSLTSANLKYEIDETITYPKGYKIIAFNGEKIYGRGNEIPILEDVDEGTYTYKFIGYDVKEENGLTVYIAKYEKCEREYKISFYNYDDTLIEVQRLKFGSIVTPPVATKPSDELYDYVFTSWDKAVKPATADAKYTAKFTRVTRYYTIKFVAQDGTLFETLRLEYGQLPEPKLLDFTLKEVHKDYNFKCLKEEIVPVTEDKTYECEFEITDTIYVIWFLNYDDSLIVYRECKFGDEVIPPTDVTRESDKEYSYKFIGWDKEVVNCQGYEIYKALYEKVKIDYTIKFIDNDGNVLNEKTYNYGETVVVPEFNKESDETFDYRFTGLDKEVKEVDGDAQYVVNFESIYKEYIIKFVIDEKVIDEKTYHYNDTVVVPSTVTKDSDDVYDYKFSGWDKEVVNVNGDATYLATFTKTESKKYLSNKLLNELCEEIDAIEDVNLNTGNIIQKINESSSSLLQSDRQILKEKLSEVTKEYISLVRKVNEEFEVTKEIENNFLVKIIDIINELSTGLYFVLKDERWV